MVLTIPDEWLAEAGLSEADVRVEVACRLYDSSRLSFNQAIRWSGLSRVAFEGELLNRNIPVFRPSCEGLAEDLETVRKLEG